ncbi:membrane-spanning 4-domains subfamily A member 10 [Phascolarctos cinereus]|uniref:Membrane-spanning 4-domains subfamily A member 10 n=1 Tax=Phascolarctos cinereus TaxID=38626 RepID=A0A6P5JL41_PHACI|nr:membrane-spanning 4-domains subfamily A member 10 [Phascolarctos cinereus]
MAAAGERVYIVTGQVGCLVVPTSMVRPKQKAPVQDWIGETPHSGFFLQEDRHRGIWRKAGPLTKLGVFRIVNALLHITVGIYLATAVKNLHLVAMKSWYPFWGAFFFLCSGALLITMERGRKMKLKTLTVTVSIVDCFCALCGIFMFIKDLFWERSFESPIWRPYPFSMVHLQRLELGLLVFSSLEVFAFICTMSLLYKMELSSEVKEDSIGSSPPVHPDDPAAPPPAYEDIARDDKKEGANP